MLGKQRNGVFAAIVINTFVWILRLVAGVLSSGSALIADAWHTMSDNASSVIIYLASKIASKPPDKLHPYGHGKSVDVATFIMGLILLAITAFLTFESINRVISGYSIIAEYTLLAVNVLVLTCVMKELLARYALRLYKITGVSHL